MVDPAGMSYISYLSCLLIVYIVCVFVGVIEKGANMGLPSERGDMQSDHACACFVRVGRRRRGSILGSILESFWGPSSPLYSFWVALVAKTRLKKSINKCCVFGGPRHHLTGDMPGSKAPRATGSRADNTEYRICRILCDQESGID